MGGENERQSVCINRGGGEGRRNGRKASMVSGMESNLFGSIDEEGILIDLGINFVGYLSECCFK